MALFHLALQVSGMERAGLAAGARLPNAVVLGTWLLESLGLSALFLLIQGQGSVWLAGLLAGWIAWVFRGPLLVLTVAGTAGMAGAAGAPAGRWWPLALSWWFLYTVCGLLLGGTARATGLRP